MKRLLLVLTFCIIAVSVGSLPALAATAPLQYRGGPILRKVTIYPLYYGNWSSADITAQQNYLTGLAGYMSGKNNPADKQPMMWQYGVTEVTIAPPVTTGPTTVSIASGTVALNIIKENQKNGKLPAFNESILVMVFPATGLGGGAYHSSDSHSAFWSVVPQNSGLGPPVSGPYPSDTTAALQLVTAHEIFEAVADPAIQHAPGWDETVDGCPDGLTKYGGTWIKLSFGWVPGVIDNTQNGACSKTGYTSTNEVQVYGWSYADYKKKYDELWPKGWRLYILQSYVLPGGKVRYNAVWRPDTSDEIQVYGWSYADYKKKYDELKPQGWRLYILQSYVMPSNQILYNAVWRKGSFDEEQVDETSYETYRSQYDQLWTKGWRLQSLQSYVADGNICYNAVWRPGDSPEFQVYGWSYTEYRKKYDELWPQGWRLYSLQSYVTSDGKTLYNAVWRLGNMPEIQVYGWKYADYRKKYDELWPKGWRLYVLDSYVMPNGEVLYNAVWRIGTSNRPL